MGSLSQDQIKVLEQTRQRLVQLTHSLGSLVGSINQSDPLPPWSSLQSQASIISNNLLNVSQQLSTHHELLSSLVAYPGPNFPGQTQAAMLSQLVRTKLEPRVEDWVSRGRVAGNAKAEGEVAGGLDAGQGKESLLSDEELKELWSWAPIEANEEARKRDWGGDFTLEEREMGVKNVVTGLKRRLDEGGDEESSEEEDEEDNAGVDEDEMDIVGVHRKNGGSGVEFQVARERDHVPPQALSSAMPLDEVFRYMMTGTRRNT
ncbi:mediator of RNA polymerase II transcription subunit 8 [Arachnomyces sp. PD_36]|nr:mediator of RNA polymerase II transcription subunit 8 [Arachnomyces sp. PD_36]